MTHTENPIPLNEFAENLTAFFERVIHENEPIVIENEAGEKAVLKPVRPHKIRRRAKTRADHESFLASAGTWSDVDTDTFLEKVYASREISTRNPVDL